MAAPPDDTHAQGVNDGPYRQPEPEPVPETTLRFPEWGEPGADAHPWLVALAYIVYVIEVISFLGGETAAALRGIVPMVLLTVAVFAQGLRRRPVCEEIMGMRWGMFYVPGMYNDIVAISGLMATMSLVLLLSALWIAGFKPGMDVAFRGICAVTLPLFLMVRVRR